MELAQETRDLVDLLATLDDAMYAASGFIPRALNGTRACHLLG